ncbi:receptor-type tyrosine-protein phosphatase H isoform X1 [Silurus meridionalis]|uniref:receptor-type tyrosine-protein phosphatase H isoform X1 n=1 Tax=Silurus meridionalis TaxID=175797 RepID=UPI001EEC1922|nr:receptor-type tyrosine-protein phosphatase H isoform X1 [Silurus meridionalis]
MLLLPSLLLVAVSISCAERDYFYKENSTTWENARFQCQACYKDLTTITPTNAELLSMNLTSDYWIGLRKNVTGSKFWSRWANGEPVLYQNWYPGHPIPIPKPEPPPCSCPTPPIINTTKTEAKQCPVFTDLCGCLNSFRNTNDSEWENSTMSNQTVNSTVTGMMFCPSLAKLCDCLNTSKAKETSILASTTMFTTTYFVPSTTPPMIASTILPINVEPKYIEDSCVTLLSFGMWQEKQCNESLPYICYDDRFSSDLKISNLTKTEGLLSWTKASGNITHYIIVINGKLKVNVTNDLKYQISGMDPGTFYTVQVIPVKCNRALNDQRISYYTLPEEIRNLTIVSVETNTITLIWDVSKGTAVHYLVNIQPDNLNKTSSSANYSITSLRPGKMYSITITAVVNETVFGDSAKTTACTRPLKVMNLTSSNDENDTIFASWVYPDSNNNLIYNITLDNKNHFGPNQTITLSNLTAGTIYTLTVSVSVAGCNESGEVASISAYTIPMSVSNLELSSGNDSIRASWTLLNGNYAWFKVTISSNMILNSSVSKTTNYLNYNFTSLKAAALYTVSVINYVQKDLKPSHPVTKSIYTRLNAPGKASVQGLNNSALNISWEVPANSQEVQNITYRVKYVSDFWGDSGTQDIIGETSVIIGGLKSGTKYRFNVTVFADNSESLPSQTYGLTDANIRTLTLTMLCSSSTQLYCMNNTTMQNVLDQVSDKYKNEQ